jgi:hypothetical protein
LNDPVPSAFFLLEWIRKLWSPARWRELICLRRQFKDAESRMVARLNGKSASSAADAGRANILRSSRGAMK